MLNSFEVRSEEEQKAHRKAILRMQLDFCEKYGYPVFMPFGGFCYQCRQDFTQSMTLQQAGGEVLTGCPLCPASWCD